MLDEELSGQLLLTVAPVRTVLCRLWRNPGHVTPNKLVEFLGVANVALVAAPLKLQARWPAQMCNVEVWLAMGLPSMVLIKVPRQLPEVPVLRPPMYLAIAVQLALRPAVRLLVMYPVVRQDRSRLDVGPMHPLQQAF